MQKTLQALITEVQRELYQSAGPSVQVYSQDILAQKLQHAFDTIFQAKHWPQFRTRETRTLNGTTGKTTVPFTLIRQWDDVEKVFRRYSPHPIPELPLSFNTLDFIGSAIRYLEPAADTTLFTAYPLTAIDQIVVVGRARPTAEYGLAGTVPFDHLALVYYATWEYLVDDASNPAAAAKYQGLFDSRIKTLWDDAQEHVIALNPHRGDIPMEWH